MQAAPAGAGPGTATDASQGPAGSSDRVQVTGVLPQEPPVVRATVKARPEPSPTATGGAVPVLSEPRTGAAQAQVGAGEPNTPRIRVEKAEFDLGEVSTNSKNTAQFKLANAGRGTLEIQDVIKCCGAVVELDKQRLEPGETAELTVDYYTGDVAGQFKRELTVRTNDPIQAATTLTILGKVVQRLVWKPLQLRLFLDKPNLGCGELVLTALDGKPFSIQDTLSTGDCITVAYDPNAQATEFVLKPAVDRDKLLALAYAKGTFQLKLTRPDYGMLHIPFDLLPNYSVNPAQLILFNAEPGKKELRKIHVLDNYVAEGGQADLTVDSVTSDHKSVSVTKTEKIKDGLVLYAEIDPPVLDEGERSFSDEIRVQVKGGEELTVTVRIFYSPKGMAASGRSATQP